MMLHIYEPCRFRQDFFIISFSEPFFAPDLLMQPIGTGRTILLED